MQESIATVVLVDDDKQIRDALGWVLQSVGLRVESCGSPEQALAVCCPETVGCLVLDLQLPGMNGFELAQRIKAGHPRLPIVLATGYAELPADRSIEFGHLSKPYTSKDLAAALEKALVARRP